RAGLLRKDARIVLDVARSLGAPVPAFEVAAERLERLVEGGDGNLDNSALVVMLEREAGVRVGER
ncbi:MAG: NAD-binding protein, partial [Actinomycetota bacterium]